MEIEQDVWIDGKGWQHQLPGRLGDSAQLVLIFGSPDLFKEERGLDDIKKAYPVANLAGCSSAGNISGTRVYDDAMVIAAIKFDHTQVEGAMVGLGEDVKSFEAGARLAHSLDKDGLVHVLVLSDGVKANGSELVKGLTSNLPRHVTVTGGLAGDDARFQETFVMLNAEPRPGAIAGLGFYGNRLKVGFGSLGGWDPFGPERVVTRSVANVLYELDSQPALELYKRYLGEHAAGLPATGLLFPLSLGVQGSGNRLVRTTLAVDDEEGSITFAGDVPEGATVQLMKANFERLVEGAAGAARISYEAIGSSSPDLAVLISCVGRKLVLKQMIEEEVEGVQDVLGEQTPLTGFYSNGEIAPFDPTANCELHNQTMTVTTFSES